MTTTPNYPTTALQGRPPVVNVATWQAARDGACWYWRCPGAAPVDTLGRQSQHP